MRAGVVARSTDAAPDPPRERSTPLKDLNALGGIERLRAAESAESECLAEQLSALEDRVHVGTRAANGYERRPRGERNRYGDGSGSSHRRFHPLLARIPGVAKYRDW